MPKERISLTLDNEVLERVDRKLEKRGIENRSRGIEELLQEYLKSEEVDTALVLAGGESPGALVRINGRPVVEHIIDHLEDSGMERVFVATGDTDFGKSLEDREDVDIDIFLEEEPLGTAGCLRNLEGNVDDTFAVVNGDVLCEVDIRDMKAAHDESDGLATLALTTVRDSSNYGVIRMKGNRVVGFKEKPDESFSNLINAGVYLIDSEMIERLPGEEERKRIDLEEIFENLAGEDMLTGYVYEGEWREVG